MMGLQNSDSAITLLKLAHGDNKPILEISKFRSDDFLIIDKNFTQGIFKIIYTGRMFKEKRISVFDHMYSAIQSVSYKLADVL